MKVKMIQIIRYVLVLILFFEEVKSKENRKINKIVEQINKHRKNALSYTFSDDAREYESKDKWIKGRRNKINNLIIPGTNKKIFVTESGTYDFIIVGAGPAGCIIANKLSENPKWKILLLEAGTFRDSDITDIPALYREDTFTKFNWGYRSVPQKTGCRGECLSCRQWTNI